MIRIASEDELKSCFRELDRDEVQVPSTFKFPFAVKHYASWVEPSGARVYLVYEDQISAMALGVVFQRARAGSDAPPSVCQWCHTVKVGGGVGLLTAMSSPTRRVGLHACVDLGCKDNVPGVNDFFESLNPTERLQRILSRMDTFARRNLF